ncbi:MAG TPA: SPOR domain-containing protein [Burkholderiaceae bacterium]|nr:SPOR domain-containing protein [Burkholderiaceae bacterium]
MAIFKSGRTDNSRDDTDVVRRSARSTTDPSLALKRKARQRLIGAMVIALGAVIVLPMLLDAEPRPVSQDIPISIPSKDTPKSSANKSASNTASATAKVESPKPEIPKTELAKPAPVTEPPSIARSEAKPPEAPKESTATKDDANKALALLEARPTENTSKSGKYAVQVGAFSSEDKAKELQARLKGVGVPTYVERAKTSSGERVRLRAGPFASREAAEAARAKINAHGAAGAVLVTL